MMADKAWRAYSPSEDEHTGLCSTREDAQKMVNVLNQGARAFSNKDDWTVQSSELNWKED